MYHRLTTHTCDEHPEAQSFDDDLRTLFQQQLIILGLEDCPNMLSIEQKIESIRQVYPHKKLIVVTDALNDLADFNDDNQLARMEEMLRRMHALAVRTDSHQAIIAHMKKHDGKPRWPILADLKGSSFMEHIAQSIFLYYNESHYVQNSQLRWRDPVTSVSFPVFGIKLAKDKLNPANIVIPMEFNPLTMRLNEPLSTNLKYYQSVIEKDNGGVRTTNQGDNKLGMLSQRTG
jgi:hypothetical protein